MTRQFALAAIALLSAAYCTDRAAAAPQPPPIFVDLEITFQPNPPPIIPADTWQARFFNLVQGDQPGVLIPDPGSITSFNITPLAGGHFSSGIFIPTDPCFGGSTCNSFNFGLFGTTGGFPTTAFGPNDPIPGGLPTPPPIVPIDLSSLIGGVPSPPPIKLSGPIFAFDDPINVGQWDITISTQPLGVPGPVVGAGLPGLLAGFSAMLVWRKRRRTAV